MAGQREFCTALKLKQHLLVAVVKFQVALFQLLTRRERQGYFSHNPPTVRASTLL